MKAVILAGGYGTRLSEETQIKPKPMVEIGGKPMLWHIMKIYSFYGIKDFIICCGYKGYQIKEYFKNYLLHNSDVTFDLGNNSMEIHKERTESWKVTLVDTGVDTMTGGRLLAIKKYLDDDTFCFTYGDGVADINITKLIDFHKNHGLLATLTSAVPQGRFGTLTIENSFVRDFQEKPEDKDTKVNAGFFVLSNKVFSYIEDSQTIWEREPLEKLAKEGQLMAFSHSGFWQPMDTLRDVQLLEDLWSSNKADWKVWN